MQVAKELGQIKQEVMTHMKHVAKNRAMRKKKEAVQLKSNQKSKMQHKSAVKESCNQTSKMVSKPRAMTKEEALIKEYEHELAESKAQLK